MICIRSELYPPYIPVGYYKNSTCRPQQKFERYGLNLIYLMMNDSFSLDFYANLLAGGIIAGIGAGDTAFDGFLLAKNPWKTTDSVSTVTYESISMNGKWSCFPKGTGCKTVKPAVIVGINPTVIEKTNILIYNRKIMNPDMKSITIYDMMGKSIIRSSHSVIDLDNMPPGIFLIQEDQKVPIKHFFY